MKNFSKSEKSLITMNEDRLYTLIKFFTTLAHEIEDCEKNGKNQLYHIAKESSSDGTRRLELILFYCVSKIIRGDFGVSSRNVYNVSDDAFDTIDRSVFLSFINNEIAILESMQLRDCNLTVYKEGYNKRLVSLMK